jgi:glutathione synthase/RimK-type ligase-like ATP-grasp enzyme
MMARWRARKCIVEVTAYQKTLEWLLKEEMKKARQYYLIQPFVDNKRPKHQRIVDGLTAVASNRMLFCRPDQAEFIDQFIHYSQIKKIKKDDVIETVAIAIIDMSNIGDIAGLDSLTLDEADYREINTFGGCP